MNEATLKTGLVRALRHRLPGAVVLRHEDRFRAGIPDISVTWRPRAGNGQIHARTLWVEVKYDRPRARGRLTAIQEHTLRRLGGLLVVYVEDPGGERGVKAADHVGWVLANTWQGFDHQAVAQIIVRRLE